MAEQPLPDSVAVLSQEPFGVARIPEVLDGFQQHWLGSFVLNLLGYGLIILPAALLIRRWKKDPAVQSGENRSF